MTLQTNNEADKKARKSLSEQIDRLDSLLDGLADNLNSAVADAVRDAVGGAVREAVHATPLELSPLGHVGIVFAPPPTNPHVRRCDDGRRRKLPRPTRGRLWD